ncbi:MAG: restriction endonuclease subunit S [Nitrospira sp.]|nr:restriction endonuclease subunit S [Nitrospira sp.]
MTDAIDLTKEQRSQLTALLRRFIPGVAVWAYGSRVKWTARLNSDLDLVAFTTPAQRSQVADLKDALAESNLPFPVDLHVWDDVPERFREIIQKEYVVMQEAKQQPQQPDIRGSYVETRTGGRPATTGVISGDFALSVGKPDRPVPSGWRWTALSDVARLESGHTPSRRHPEYWGGDVPWIGIKDATENHGRVLTDTFQHTNELGIANSSARILPANTVCLSRTASVGYVVVMGKPMATSQDFVNWVCSDALDHQFLKYVLLAEHSAFLRFASGTTHQTIYFPEVKAFHVCLPPLPEQRAIAHILGTLDYKIELNRRMNETLEAMARALFKSWFVDFDPVRAKAEGRDADLPKHLVDLFPDSFEDSELGEVPRGWEVKLFADTIEIVGGGTPKTSVAEYWDGDIPWFSVVDAPTNSEVWVVDTEKKVTRAGIDKSSTSVLPVGTTIISARGTVGRIALVGLPMAMNQSCYGLRGRAGAQGFFNYFSTRQLVTRLQQHAHGSVFDTITRDTLAGVSVAVPAVALIEEFENRVAPSLQRIRAGLLETRTLTALRDTLLPKLISGEVRVKDAEASVGLVL